MSDDGMPDWPWLVIGLAVLALAGWAAFSLPLGAP